MASQKSVKQIPIVRFCQKKTLAFPDEFYIVAEKLHMCDGQGQKVQRKWWGAEPPKNIVYMSPQWPPFLHYISTQNAEEFSGNSCHVFPCTMKLRATKCWPVVSNAGLTCDKQLYFSFSSKWILDQVNIEQAHKPRRNVSPKLRPTRHPVNDMVKVWSY